MNSLTLSIDIHCAHRDLWPPAYAFQGIPLAVARLKMEHDEISRAETWEQQCGKTKMDDRCLNCKHVKIPAIKAPQTTPIQRKARR